IVVIPPKSNRKEWRGIATRYCKNVDSFEAAVQICCLMIWLTIS
ncbi:MAG: IS5/IS1182 family transposase, partial [Holosporales bacterium]|nr:IS5/IS1182 family transposase [Holosporales bacterium]